MLNREPGLTDEMFAMQETAHRFAEKVMRPAGLAIDRMTPEQAIASDSPLWNVHEQYRELGLNLVEVADEFTPVELALTTALVSEELGWGDLGLGWSCYAATFPAAMAQASGQTELTEKFTYDQIGCWGITEPNHGSDALDFTGQVSPNKENKWDCVVTRHGDTLAINGQKAAWVSNGCVAETMALFCGYDDGSGNSASAGFLVPLDLPGVSRGKPLHKLGVRSLPDGEIYFDNVEIPVSHMVIGPDAYPQALASTLTGANPSMVFFMTGMARSAYEHALAYAKERKQGGQILFEHPTVRLRLFEMYRKIQASRALARQVMQTHAQTDTPYYPFAASAKVTGTTLCMEVANMAFDMFGGNAQTEDYPVEKLVRDARMGTIADGTNEVLSLMASTKL